MTLAPGAVALAALLAGVAAVERKAAFQLMLSRPIVLGPLLGWALGDTTGGIMLGAPLELLFCGAANLGAILPQHETAATVAIVPAAVAAGHVDPAMAFAAFAVGAPVALLGRTLEGFAERANEVVAGRASLALSEGRIEGALRMHLLGLTWPFVGSAAMAVVAVLLGGPLVSGLHGLVHPRVLELGYGLLWAAGGAAAVRAARLPRPVALALLGASFATLLILIIGVLS